MLSIINPVLLSYTQTIAIQPTKLT